MAIPDGVCRFDGVGASGRSKGEKHPMDMCAGRDKQSKKQGGSYMSLKEKHSGGDGACPARKADGAANLGTNTQHFNATSGPSNKGGGDSRPADVRKFQDGVKRK